jgi:hypothetical protein
MTGEGKALLVRVAAAPEKGHANDELVTWLAKRLGIPRSSVSIRTGLTARLKNLVLPAAARIILESIAGET